MEGTCDKSLSQHRD